MESSPYLRQNYHQEFDEIFQSILKMGGLVNELVRSAIEAALNGDSGMAGQVLLGDDEIDRMEQEIYKKTVSTVLKQAPVAAEFRALVATLGVVGEIEKAADDAVKLARRVRKIQSHFPKEMKLPLLQLGEVSRQMFTSALRLYAGYSPELAEEIIANDEDVDSRYSEARKQVIEMIRENPQDSEHLVRTIDCFHALEHVADHAVEIARRLRMLYN